MAARGAPSGSWRKSGNRGSGAASANAGPIRVIQSPPVEMQPSATPRATKDGRQARRTGGAPRPDELGAALVKACAGNATDARGRVISGFGAMTMEGPGFAGTNGGFGCVRSGTRVPLSPPGAAEPAAKASGLDLVNRMKATPSEDDCFGRGVIRQDGRRLIPSFLFEVKSPAESRGPWDFYKLLQTTPADEAFRPLSEGGCPLVRA